MDTKGKQRHQMQIDIRSIGGSSAMNPGCTWQIAASVWGVFMSELRIRFWSIMNKKGEIVRYDYGRNYWKFRLRSWGQFYSNLPNFLLGSISVRLPAKGIEWFLPCEWLNSQRAGKGIIITIYSRENGWGRVIRAIARTLHIKGYGQQNIFTR